MTKLFDINPPKPTPIPEEDTSEIDRQKKESMMRFLERMNKASKGTKSLKAPSLKT